MKHTIVSLSLFLALALAPAVPVLAVDVISPACPNVVDPVTKKPPAVCTDNLTSNSNDQSPITGPDGLISKVVNIISLIGGIIAGIVIIIGGVKLVTSGGDSNSVASSRRTILYAIFSVVIIAVAQLIVRFIINRS